MNKLAIGIFAFIVSNLALAENWILFSKTEEGQKSHFYDSDRVKMIDDEIYKVWYKIENINEINVRYLINTNIDCRNESIDLKEMYSYYKDTQLATDQDRDGFFAPPPGTASFQLIDEICNK